MNIMQVLPQMELGGVETGTLDLSRELVKLGHKVVVVSAGGKLVDELRQAGVIHYKLPVHKKSPFSMLRMVGPLSQIIEKEGIDIVHARSRVPAWPAFFAARKTRKVFITTCHGYYSMSPFSAVMGWGKRVIVLSNAIGRHMIEDFGVPHERIRLIPRSVDLARFTFIPPGQKRKDTFNVGIIGRITPLKGHRIFIQAMAKVAQVVPQLKIWIVGDAPASKQDYKEELKILAKRLGLANLVEFLGVQRNIPEILNHLDLLVLATTTQEAFGRVIIEAQAAGVPVVATRVGGVVDIIDDGINGLLVPAGDAEVMAKAVIRIFQDLSFSERLAENALERIKENYTLERMVRATLQVYEEALRDLRILVIKMSSLGDVILATAALKALHRHFQNSPRISVLVSRQAKDILMRCPYIEELIVIDTKGKDRGILGLLRIASELRKKSFSISIDFQNNRLSHMLGWLSAIPERYGYLNNKLGFLLNRGIADDVKGLAPVEHQFRVLKMLGIEFKNDELQMWPSSQDELYVEGFLASQWLSPKEKLVGINVSSSSRWQTKNWPLDYIVRFCLELGRRDIRVVLTGGSDATVKAHLVVSQVKGLAPINACGKTTINQLACLIRRCNVYVSTDSAPLHIAASVKTPFVALFGPTDSKRHLPPAQRYIVLEKKLSCRPCYRPRCSNSRCLNTITPEEVVKAVESLLNLDKV